MRIEFNLTWVWLAASVPLVAGVLTALPFWLARARDEVGSIVGSGVILMCVIGLIAREYGTIEAVTAHCVQLDIGCHFHPAPFVRYAIFGGIGMVQVFVVFLTGLSVEERLRRSGR